MPDVVIHMAMGNSVLHCLNSNIVSLINIDIFQFGLLGPDPHIYYRFFAPHFHHGINRRSYLMHNTRTSDFLTELAKNADTPEKFSYLAGFLCHYALDATVHPLVNVMAENDDNKHRAIEHRLDRIELERLGKQLNQRPISRLFPHFLPNFLSEYVGLSMKKVYGWSNAWAYLKISYIYMKVFYWIIQDPYGLLDRIVKHTEGKASKLSYQSHFCDGMDFTPFYKLIETAEKDAIGYIEGAFALYNKLIEEEEFLSIIGNRSYVTG